MVGVLDSLEHSEHMDEQHDRYPMIKGCLSKAPPEGEPTESSVCSTADEEMYFYM